MDEDSNSDSDFCVLEEQSSPLKRPIKKEGASKKDIKKEGASKKDAKPKV